MHDVMLSSNQSFLTVDAATGVQSDNVFDLEEGGVTDEMMGPLWLNFVLRGTPVIANLTEGVRFTLLTSDSATLASGNIEVVSSGIILPAQLVAGFRASWGFYKFVMHKYLRVRANAVSTAESAGTSFLVDMWLDERPIQPLTSQKELT